MPELPFQELIMPELPFKELCKCQMDILKLGVFTSDSNFTMSA